MKNTVEAGERKQGKHDRRPQDGREEPHVKLLHCVILKGHAGVRGSHCVPSSPLRELSCTEASFKVKKTLYLSIIIVLIIRIASCS